MSVATIAQSGLRGSKRRRSRPPTWIRPADWLSLPELAVGQQKFVGLHAVYDTDSNFVALSAAGAYTVDWGDGVVEDFASGVQANHVYDYSTLPAGSLTSENFRQAIVTVTPQAGQNLTALNFYLKHSQAGLQNGYGTGWLDMRIVGAQLANLTIGPSTTVVHTHLQRFEYVGPSAITLFNNTFQGCFRLQEVAGAEWTAAGTSFANTFSGCTALLTIPRLDTHSATTMTGTFQGCSALRSVPLLNTANVTNMTNLFGSCYALASVPPFDTANVTNFSFMFDQCRSLRSVPLFNTVSATNMNQMFGTCFSLTSIPLFNTANVTNMNSMFSGCVSLQSIPLLNTVKVNTVNAMFTNCNVLKMIPLLNLAAVTNFSNMFNGCAGLLTVPLLNTANATSVSGMFQGCTALQSVPLLNVANVSSAGGFSNIFQGCVSLARGALSGARFAISYLNCKLSAAELNRIYTNLGVASGAQAITVTGNYGVAADDPTIATAKGWTVTGS